MHMHTLLFLNAAGPETPIIIFSLINRFLRAWWGRGVLLFVLLFVVAATLDSLCS